MELSRRMNCEVICFDHRKSILSSVQSPETCLEKVEFHVDVERSSSSAVYEHFSNEVKQKQGVRADGNANLSDEIGKHLSLSCSAAGLRPIGAVIYMQRNNLKMCLRSMDSSTDTSKIAKDHTREIITQKSSQSDTPSSYQDEHDAFLEVVGVGSEGAVSGSALRLVNTKRNRLELLEERPLEWQNSNARMFPCALKWPFFKKATQASQIQATNEQLQELWRFVEEMRKNHPPPSTS